MTIYDTSPNVSHRAEFGRSRSDRTYVHRESQIGDDGAMLLETQGRTDLLETRNSPLVAIAKLLCSSSNCMCVGTGQKNLGYWAHPLELVARLTLEISPSQHVLPCQIRSY